MGTAVLFLVLLDAIILVGEFGASRLEIAAIVTAIVLGLIALIWIRNTKLEELTGLSDDREDVGKRAGKDGRT